MRISELSADSLGGLGELGLAAAPAAPAAPAPAAAPTPADAASTAPSAPSNTVKIAVMAAAGLFLLWAWRSFAKPVQATPNLRLQPVNGLALGAWREPPKAKPKTKKRRKSRKAKKAKRS